MAIEVTDEMRQAVYEADCAAQGHIFNYGHLMDGAAGVLDLRGPNGQVPHIWCNRCGKVWLVIETPGLGYDDAVAKLKDRFKPGDGFHNRP